MSKFIEAIPTEYRGVLYRSRLEFRFAEMLTEEAMVEFKYEKKFPGSQGYISDFFLPAYGLYIEIKPRERLKETDIFYNNIMSSSKPWICVDRLGRDKWRVIAGNPAFRTGTTHGPTKITFLPDRMRFQADYMDLYPMEDEIPAPEPEPQSIASPETHRLYFAKMRELLGGKE